VVAATPFALLQDIDQRCRDNARGLPTGKKVVDDWTGIGFKLVGTRLIAPMSEVAEILPPPDCIRVPRVLNWVVGLANVRGNLMPVLDMNIFLQSKPIDRKNESRVLIVDRDGVVAALLVEEVFGLRRFKPEMRHQADSSSMGLLEPYLEGAFDDNQDQWRVFSMDKLIHHEQFLKVV
jgi:twitching motility protein PilI